MNVLKCSWLTMLCFRCTEKWSVRDTYVSFFRFFFLVEYYKLGGLSYYRLSESERTRSHLV